MRQDKSTDSATFDEPNSSDTHESNELPYVTILSVAHGKM